MTLECFIEYVVCGFLNLYTYNFTTSGEILGFIFAIFCPFCAIIFVPLALVWAVCTKDEL